MHLHVGVKTLAIIKLFDTLLALKCEAMGNKVCHWILVDFTTLFTCMQLVRVGILNVGSSGT